MATAAGVASLRQKFYPDVVRRDPVARFVERLQAAVRPGDRVLDLGAGAGELNRYALKGRAGQLIGVDVDPRVGQNPLLDAGVRGDVCALPFADATFDVVFSIYVLEHIPAPERLAADIYRVLRPGGLMLSLTPNLYHYVTLASMLSPTAFHRWINEKRGRSADDTFPTCYQLNSHAAQRRRFADAGFEPVAIEAIEVQPNYLTFNTGAFALGVLYERVVNATDWLSPLRVNLISTFRKPAAR